MSESYTLYFSISLMLVLGTVGMLILKFQHMQLAPMSPGAEPTHFDHPWIQAALMMAGEALCLPVYLLNRSRGKDTGRQDPPRWYFLVPCCCDLIASGLLCTGLAFIPVSVAQMCRGTVIIFVCAMSFVFLRRGQSAQQLIGVGLTLLGIALVSLGAFKVIGIGTSEMRHLVIGISICILAQIFCAGMFVAEESIMAKYTVEPLQVVAIEGSSGLLLSIFLLFGLQSCGLVNIPGAIHQIRSSTPLLLSVFGYMMTIPVFYLAGATVTQRSSAVARTTIKIASTILIWIAELGFGWNAFSRLQFDGFIFIALGTITYNSVIAFPSFGGEKNALLVQKAPQSEHMQSNNEKEKLVDAC